MERRRERRMIKIDKENDLPKDTVSCIKWYPNRNAFFGVSSFDGYFRIYHAAGDVFYHTYEINCQMPLTCFEYINNFDVIFAGTITGSIIMIEPYKKKDIKVVKCFNAPILSIIYDHESDLLYIFKKGTELKTYDPKSFKKINDFTLDFEISTVNYHKGTFIVGGCELYCFFNYDDLLDDKLIFRQNRLNSPISTVAFCDDSGYSCVGDYDGRCCFNDERGYEESKVIFPHSVEQITRNGKTDKSFPVYGANKIRINNLDTFYFYGGNHELIIWSINRKKMIMKLQFDDTITALDYHKKLKKFVVAIGYDWNEKIHELDKVNQFPQIILFKV